MSIEFDFKGQTVLVTGSTRGIGAAIVKDFIRAQANVIITGHDEEELKQVQEHYIANGIMNIQYYHLEFTDDDSLNAFLKGISGIERLDICINNAGTNRNNYIDETLIDDYNYLQQVNLKAPFLICREISKIMKKQNYGRIVNIASIWGVISRPKRSIYSLTKFGLVGLTKAMAADLAPHGVLVNAVSPGFTLTELTRNTVTEEEIKVLSDMIPMQRFAEPEEISKIVLFLSSSLNTYVTGQNIIIDGGFTSV